jgi:hypothetical protein
MAKGLAFHPDGVFGSNGFAFDTDTMVSPGDHRQEHFPAVFLSFPPVSD